MFVIGESLVELYARHKWKFVKRGDRAYVVALQGETQKFDFWAFINKGGVMLALYALVPLIVPAAKRNAVGEFLHMVNFNMLLGSFEMDYKDGELRYKLCADFDGEKPSLDAVGDLYDCALATVDRYFPSLAGMLFANLTPQQAIELVEGEIPKEERSSIVQ